MVRILLADEQSLFREAVRAVLDSETDLEVVAEAHDGLEAVAEAERTQPDVALLGADLPNCDGIRATSLITSRLPGCGVIVLSGEEDDEILVGALEAGARGYLTKSSRLPSLIEATRTVHRGEVLIPTHMLRALLDRLLRRTKERDAAMRRLARLTPRERQVLAVLAEGGDNHRIAEALVISPETARTHIQNVLSKLGVHSRLEAAAFVIQNGMLDEEELHASRWGRDGSSGDGRPARARAAVGPS